MLQNKNLRGKFTRTRVLSLLLAAVLITSLAGCAAGSSGSSGSASSSVSSSASGPQNTSASSAGDTSEFVPDPSLPGEYQYALKEAWNYAQDLVSKTATFHHLTERLTLPEEVAQYAIDNIGVDWNEVALKRAKFLCDRKHMSKDWLQDFMVSTFLTFTPEEAQYAMDHLDVDWNDVALARAKFYRNTMGLSDDVIRAQLTGPYVRFTEEEANYAIQHLN